MQKNYNLDIKFIKGLVSNRSCNLTLLFKILAILIIVLNLLSLTNVLNPYIFFFDVDKVLQHNQYWRIFTFTFGAWNYYQLFLNLFLLVLLSSFLKSLQKHYSTIYILSSMIFFCVVLSLYHTFTCYVIRISGYRTDIYGGLIPLWTYLFLTHQKLNQKLYVNLFFIPCKIKRMWRAYIICLVFIYLQWQSQSVFIILSYFLTLKNLKIYFQMKPRNVHKFLQKMICYVIKQRKDVTTINQAQISNFINSQEQTQITVNQEIK